ncbi:MAG: nuclear transport factor 2 family protein, partial [Acidimicrobiia bacterium]|nr:nuclear transport factor 2 family protein [Acidimicrobiia bacterium]
MGFIFQPGTRTLPTQRLEPPAATLGPSLADRAALCTTALEALTLGDHTRLDQLFTDDLWFRSPHVSVRSRVELIRAVGQPESTLRDIDISLEPCAITESALAAEWRIDARLTEPLLLGDNLLIEPTADRLHLFGAT